VEKSKTALIEAIREYPSGDIYDTDAAVSIGSMAEADIALPEGAGEINISLHPGRIYVFSGEANVNGNLITQGSAPVMAGDAMLIGGVLFTVKTGGIEIRGSAQSVNLRKRLTPEGRMDMSAFPAFRRPPRIVRSLPEKSIEIALPPAKEKAPKGQLLKTILPPLIMVMLTVTVSLISKGGIYVIVMAAGMGVTVIFSITNYFSEKKERKEKEAKRTEKYRAYLLGKRKEIYAAQKEEAESRRYMSPSLADIAGMTDDYSSRLYERTPFDDDFLSVTLGASEISPLTCVLVAEEDMLKEADELADEAKGAADNFMALKDMPTPVNLRNAHIGLVGERREIAPVLKSITAQLSFLHSYDDMQILIVTAEENAAEFAYARWLPHMSLRAVNVTGLVAGESAKEQIIGSLSQILKDRKTRKDEGNKVSLYSPHYVLIIDDPRLISGHSIEEYLKDRDSALGLSLIWTTNMRESLPENIGTVITLEGGGRAVLALDEYVPKRTEIRLYDTDSVNFAMLARKLAPIIHDKGASSRIPEQVSYFDMYGIKSPKELALEKLWSRADSAKSLAVPLGERAAGDTVYLDLHERAHGPHGLVAGTTGSGKSEVLQSYILSLACHFSPHEVGFLLIDYKGGGMANLFDGLPHLLGTITNLDGGESMRALASIKSELKRRQSIFAEAGVNNINLYTKAYKRGEASLPLPHLFIISDEFAELKKEQPDFMAELVSTARIGRTLGVHLILATQKPSGVVDDQIWSNSRFKIALKVQNTSDSNEVLHTPDAASITQPGRCYLQVGNNEIYELFQSTFSGASYSEEEAGTGYDKRIWRINDLGQGELINEDLSATVKDESKATQLDVIVNHIAEVHKALGMEEVEKPWLPPLESSVVNPNFEAETKPRKDDEGADLAVPIGVVDILN
jgi:S-DNA-T family DNA segregation ATPase FtsK/SpoIIIE